MSPVGIGTEETWGALLEGNPALLRFSSLILAGFACRFAGEVNDFQPENYIRPKRH